MAEKWGRMNGESEQAFEAFHTYRDMGLNRSLKATWESLGKSKTLISDWARDWNWKERVTAYDGYVDQRSIESNLAVREASLSEYTDAVNKSLQAKLIVVDQLASEELRRLREKQAASGEFDPMTLRRLLTIIEQADSLARRSAGLPTAYRSAPAERESEEQQEYFIVTDPPH